VVSLFDLPQKAGQTGEENGTGEVVSKATIDIKARLDCVLNRREQPLPARPLSEDKIAEMLQALVMLVESQEKRLNRAEDALKVKGWL